MPGVGRVRKGAGNNVSNWTPARRRLLLNRFHTVPYPNWLGLRISKLDAGVAKLALPIRREHLQYQQIVHGGVLASLADTAATFAVMTVIPDRTDVITIEFKVNFLAPAEAGKIMASASAVRVGPRVAVAEVRVLGPTRDRLVMTGTFTMLVFPIAGGPSK